MTSNCNTLEIDFIINEGSTEAIAIEDNIRKNLEEIGVRVNSRARILNASEYETAELNGDYHIAFARTWGAPYDPHSYMASWGVLGSVEYRALGNLEPPITREDLLERIRNVQTEQNLNAIADEWRSILEDIHQQAIFLPLWGSRIPYVIHRRLVGFEPPPQAGSIPVHTLQVRSGSTRATVSPGVGSLFRSAGPMNPHQYDPDQSWAQDWLYEGLVSYGRDGRLFPALASSWTVEETFEGGQRVTFTLRDSVRFHDGTPWNCAAAVLNLDHVLSDAVRPRHEWLGAARHLTSWTCRSDNTLVLETDATFYPLLQEFAYIRPLRFASPSAFVMGFDSDPIAHNSCETGGFGAELDLLEDDVNCAGLLAPIGTGPFKFISRNVAEDGSDTEVVFARNDNYWGGAPNIETLTVVKYESQDDVEAALKDGMLDMALGIGPLTAKQVQNLETNYTELFDVRYSDVIQHSILTFNSNKAPMDDIATRLAIIHAIDKASLAEEEFAGLQQPVMQLLPKSAPFCNVDLSPRLGYDLEKAKLLNCPVESNFPTGQSTSNPSSQPSFIWTNQSVPEVEEDGTISGDSSQILDNPLNSSNLVGLNDQPSLESSGQPSFRPSSIPSSQVSEDFSSITFETSASSIASSNIYSSFLLFFMVFCFIV